MKVLIFFCYGCSYSFQAAVTIANLCNFSGSFIMNLRHIHENRLYHVGTLEPNFFFTAYIAFGTCFRKTSGDIFPKVNEIVTPLPFGHGLPATPATPIFDNGCVNRVWRKKEVKKANILQQKPSLTLNRLTVMYIPDKTLKITNENRLL